MWDLIVSVPDHCLSFYSEDILNVFQVRERTVFCDGRTAMTKLMSPHPDVVRA